MDDVPTYPAPRPKTVASHLINGHSPLHPDYPAEREKSEREHTFESIKASMGPHKQPLSLEELAIDGDSTPTLAAQQLHPQANQQDYQPRNGDLQSQRHSARQYEEVMDQDIEDLDVKVAARDGRDEAPLTPPASTSRSQSPFTATPTIDFDGLSWPSLGTRDRLADRLQSPPTGDAQSSAAARLEKLSGAVRTILECIGEDPEREGLHGTPERYAKAMMFFTKGYEENLRDIVNGAVFQEDHDELVIVRDIEIYSLCEHHLVPFTGKVSRHSLPTGSA